MFRLPSTNNTKCLTNKLLRKGNSRINHRAKIFDITSSSQNLHTTNPISGKLVSGWNGNYACASVAYRVSEVAMIYPITPSSDMAERAAVLEASETNNIWGSTTSVKEMQSEGGAAGALHGSVSAGALTTTFTASQGLLLMIPNMYKLAGELQPVVFHVAARAIAGQALSIFGDHQDVMACRETGFAMLSSNSVQESHDLAMISHMATLESSVPFIHFFDGFRTSHEFSKMEELSDSDLTELMRDYKPMVKKFKDQAMHPNHPDQRGTSQGPDVYFQVCEAANKNYEAVPAAVENAMQSFQKQTGRAYELFSYTGADDATDVVICMGSASETVEETVDYMNKRGAKVGVLKVHLFRPWSAKHFLNKLPLSTKRVCVLDRTKENGAFGEPLYLDVAATVQDANQDLLVIGGRFGLGSKDLTPRDAKAVFDNLTLDHPMKKFSVGIVDDVTNQSLPLGEHISTVPKGTYQAITWGSGSDGTVGASTQAIEKIGENFDVNTQGYGSFTAHKSGGVTTSFLRFGKEKITSHYPIGEGCANYVSCNVEKYLVQFDIIKHLKKGGILCINSKRTSIEALNKYLPVNVRQDIAEKQLRVLVLDAKSIMDEFGLKSYNYIMMAAFYKYLSADDLNYKGEKDVYEMNLDEMEKSIKNAFEKKGKKVWGPNIKAIRHLQNDESAITEIDVPKSWGANEKDEPTYHEKQVVRPDLKEFYDTVFLPSIRLDGDALPVSAFEKGGMMPSGTTRYEKRLQADEIPVWGGTCSQCNICALSCPHAAIRPFLVDKKQATQARSSFTQIQTDRSKLAATGTSEVDEVFTTEVSKAPNTAGLQFRIQVSAYDCTGCQVCVNACPDNTKDEEGNVIDDSVLGMIPMNKALDKGEDAKWDLLRSMPDRYNPTGNKFTPVTSQFEVPYLEFSGACQGCGETPYIKLITQLYGDRMMVANATGCSSIWGGTYMTNPYTLNDKNHGVSWANSLFEDNAEFGFGMRVAKQKQREGMVQRVEELIARLDESGEKPELRGALVQWNLSKENGEKSGEFIPTIVNLVKDSTDELEKYIFDNKDALVNISQWIFGGDGWAYDIGYGGLDHVLYSGENLNILVLDTEVYSNTGGQASKATPMGAMAKFAPAGKRSMKKDLGLVAVQAEDVYVAQVSLSNRAHLLSSIKEAEEYKGVSLIIAYAPCIAHGTDMKNLILDCEKMVGTAYWPLYNYNPMKSLDKGENPFQLTTLSAKMDLDVIFEQNRYKFVTEKFPEQATQFKADLKQKIAAKLDRLKALHYNTGIGEKANSSSDSNNKMIVLHGSETGHATACAASLNADLKLRGYDVQYLAADDWSPEMPGSENLIVLMATCGQGETPANAKEFMKTLDALPKEDKTLEHVNFSVFALGDDNYYYYCEVGKQADELLVDNGAKRLTPIDYGNDQDEDGLETGFSRFRADLFKSIEAPEPTIEKFPCTVKAIVSKKKATAPSYTPDGYESIALTKNDQLLDPEYSKSKSRDFVHLNFEKKNDNFDYNMGDALNIFPVNSEESVNDFLAVVNRMNDSTTELSDWVEIHNTNTNRELPFETSIGELFSKVLDINGIPTDILYRQMSLYATNEEEKEELLLLQARQGAFKQLKADNYSVLEVFNRFTSVKMPLHRVIESITNIKPRAYSIASAPSVHDEFNLMVLIDDMWRGDKWLRRGLTTDMLKNMQPNETVFAKVHNGAMNIAEFDKPIVMIGIGSGLAPFLSMIQERLYAQEQGEKVGKMVLIFGNRSEEDEFTYKEQLENWSKNDLFTFLPIWSRFDKKNGSKEKNPREYVDIPTKQNAKMLYQLLVKEGGYAYLCGNRGMPKLVKNAFMEGFQEHVGLSKAEAENAMKEIFTSNRYSIESW